MLTTYFISNARRKNLLLSFRTVSFVRIFILNIGLWMIGACGQLDAVGQARINNTLRYIDTIDVISRNNSISERNLIQRQANDTAKYRNFLISKNLNREFWPYYPYVLINPNYLPDAPIRVYLGKLTKGNKNDYVLLAVRCRIYRGPKRKGQIINYDDDSTSLQLKGASSIRVSRNSAINDSIFYRRVTKDTTQQYVNNFREFLNENNLQRRYRRCFVIRSKSINKSINNKRLLLLQPVVRLRPPLPRSSSGGSQNLKRFVFEDDEIIEFKGKNVCCYSPPEGGTSIEQ